MSLNGIKKLNLLRASKVVDIGTPQKKITFFVLKLLMLQRLGYLHCCKLYDPLLVKCFHTPRLLPTAIHLQMRIPKHYCKHILRTGK